jgi:hypothetical protein
MRMLHLMQAVPWSRSAVLLHDLMQESQSWALRLLAAGLVLLVGWGVAVTLERVTRAVLRAIHFDGAGGRMLGGLTPVGIEPSRLVAKVVKWIILFVAIVFMLDLLGIAIAASVGQRLGEVVPRIITSAVLLAVGSLLALVIGTTMRRVLETAGVRAARILGQFLTITLISFSALLALDQLGFAAQFVMALGVVAAATAGLGLALAFGLGCRELARDFLVEYLRALDEQGPRRPE